MIVRISKIEPLPDLMLRVVFDDGKKVLYDVKEDLDLPGYNILATVPGLFEKASLDTSRTWINWTDRVDLPSDYIYEHGKPISE